MIPPSEPPACPACGSVLPPGAPAGACPRCLLAKGMASTVSEMKTAVTPAAGDFGGAVTAELAEGAVVDRYRIGRRIGSGGMGEVYAAEQVEPVKRPVAFKVIKRGMDTEQIIARFQTERQALALMEHPNIAVVLDAGATPAGRPFFVMDFGQLAAAYSADPFASVGGRREITQTSLKKRLSDAAFSLKPGQVSPVIEDEGNYYLIRMVERQAADAKTIDLEDSEVRSAITAMIEADRREAWKEKYWRQCVEKARGK